MFGLGLGGEACLVPILETVELLSKATAKPTHNTYPCRARAICAGGKWTSQEEISRESASWCTVGCSSGSGGHSTEDCSNLPEHSWHPALPDWDLIPQWEAVGLPH